MFFKWNDVVQLQLLLYLNINDFIFEYLYYQLDCSQKGYLFGMNLFFLYLFLVKRKFNIVKLELFLQFLVQLVFYKFQLYEFGLSIVKFFDLCQ